jgi:hypothetical protein
MDESERAAVWKPPSESGATTHARTSGWWVVATITASALLPGAGQFMNRDWRRATFVLVVWLAAWIFHVSPIWKLMMLYAMVEAGIVAARRRRETLASQPT